MTSTRIPQHVAIVMDGNGRWATRQGVSTIAGHRAGEQAARAIVRHAGNLGIEYLTLYTFSSENWKRPKLWVEELMGLLRYFLRNEIKELVDNNVHLKVIGDRSLLDSDIRSMIHEAEEATANNDGLHLQLAISYGGRDDITRAVQKIAEEISNGTLSPTDINESIISAHLDTTGIPDPDLLIRTSGEMRISNFLLWQLAYSEFIFVEEYWPDFTPALLDEAIEEFQNRERRFGAKFGAIK